MTPPADSAPLSAASRGGSRVVAIAGWDGRLSAFVVWMLVVQALTGLWIYLAPFSIASQVQVLLHTVLGLVMLVPFAVYQVRHVSAWWRQRPTDVMVLGYVLLLATLTCMASGLVITWQAAAGPKVSATWRLVHLISGIGVFALLAVHLVTAVVRRPAQGSADELSVARRRFAKRVGVLTGGTVLLIAIVAAALPAPRRTFAPPPDYAYPDYVATDPEYASELRPGNPFAPSNARTPGDVLVDPGLIAGSRACGTSGCHAEILAEWQPSAHRFAAMNPPFQAVQRIFADDREPAETRYCAGCHDPISLFAGAKDIANQDLSAPGVDEGISCVGCHSISRADTRGNADYELTPPQKYLFEQSSGAAVAISDFLIRAYPRQHLADYDRNLLRTPEFCGACHKQFIPEALNGFGLVPSQNQFDEWMNGHWHTEDPETDLSCTDCHMRLVFDSNDPGRGEDGERRRTADDRTHRHHGFIATNVFMPEVLKLPHWEEQVALTEEWIRGHTVLPEIDEMWERGPVASVSLQKPPESVTAGEEAVLRVVVVNAKAGHSVTTGPLDFVRAWVHLRVVDADGKVVVERGFIDPETRRIMDRPGVPHTDASSTKDGTLVLESTPVDAEGNVLARHELWRKAGGKGKRVIFPRHTDAQTYRFTVPKDVRGPLTVTAALNYRRYRQEFLELVVPDMERDSGVVQRTVVQDSTTATIQVAQPDER